MENQGIAGGQWVFVFERGYNVTFPVYQDLEKAPQTWNMKRKNLTLGPLLKCPVLTCETRIKKLSMVPQLLVVSNRSGAEEAADEIFVLAKLFQGSGS